MKMPNLNVTFEKNGYTFNIFTNENDFTFLSIDGKGKHQGSYNDTHKCFKLNRIIDLAGRKVNSILLSDEVIAEIKNYQTNLELYRQWRFEKPFKDALAKAIQTGEPVAYSDTSDDVYQYERVILYANPDGTKTVKKIKGY